MTVKPKEDQAEGASPLGEQFLLSRRILEEEGLAALIARDGPLQRLTSEEERTASLQSMLAARPSGDIWVFAYGSLIWNPAIDIVEARKARIAGWSRSFCLSAMVGRGSPERPGLLLGLEVGGSCDGIALRIAADAVERELSLLWRREMITGAYNPQWVELCDETGHGFGQGIAFTIDMDSDHYAGNLPREEIVERLATGRGSLGSSADYLFRTRQALQAHGILDTRIEAIAADVEAALLDRPDLDIRS
ncbi:gamma-glutamylcyclotransferase [Sphingomonas sp. PR090111-T3T-6A]|uniref:gamma-glutamylcyclotransferase n=1 Tax=Sphingomonas sp. PR090111-T3T-6A TaxID=685778 RepID=UPI000365F7DC|nr:gamma-glutamylcyclotransferase [Sphingomonas sp. PR090111-T3T-6A]